MAASPAAGTPAAPGLPAAESHLRITRMTNQITQNKFAIQAKTQVQGDTLLDVERDDRQPRVLPNRIKSLSNSP